MRKITSEASVVAGGGAISHGTCYNAESPRVNNVAFANLHGRRFLRFATYCGLSSKGHETDSFSASVTILARSADGTGLPVIPRKCFHFPSICLT